MDESTGPAFSPSFGANGTALFFHTGRSSDTRSTIGTAQLGEPELHVMKIVDDGSRNFHVQPSPDGRRVAFDSDRDGERGVYVANADGTGVTRVSGAGYAAVPTWSPDGRQLAFVRGEEDRPRVWNLWLLTLDTGDMRRLTSFRYGQTWGASWFADGRRVVYSHEDRLIVHELATGATREFASPIRGRLVRTPAVSPNGRHVIFQVSKSGGWLLDLEDGSSRQVLHDPTAEEFAWSPDGRRVAFHSQRDGQWSIWFMTSS
jgi:TolB protein